MEHKGLMGSIEEIVSKELQHARESFQNMNSGHEGYAVILEEYEELQHEIEKFQMQIEQLWTSVKMNDCTLQTQNICRMLSISRLIIMEAVQLSAMCKRYSEDVLGRKENC